MSETAVLNAITEGLAFRVRRMEQRIGDLERFAAWLGQDIDSLREQLNLPPRKEEGS